MQVSPADWPERKSTPELERGAALERRREPSFELGDPLRVPGGLPMHRVLQPLHELLELRDASLEARG